MIEAALASFLREDAAVAALLTVGEHSRIFPLVIPQKIAGRPQVPCLVYAVTGENRNKTFCGTIGLSEIIVALDSYASTVLAARNLSNVVRAALLDYRGAMGSFNVKDVSLISSIVLPDMDPGLFRVSDTVSIWCE